MINANLYIPCAGDLLLFDCSLYYCLSKKINTYEYSLLNKFKVFHSSGKSTLYESSFSIHNLNDPNHYFWFRDKIKCKVIKPLKDI